VVDTVPQIEPEEIPEVASEQPKGPSFFASSTGKVVVAVIAVFVLAVEHVRVPQHLRAERQSSCPA